MKKPISLSILAALVASGNAYAQDVDNRANIYGGLGFANYDNDYQLGDGDGWLVGGEIPLSERWSATLEHWSLDADNDLTAGEVDADYTRIGGNYHFNKLGSLQPYLALGVGQLDIDPGAGPLMGDGASSIDLGLGAKAFLSEHFFLRGDIKATRSEDSTHDYLLGLAAGYAFGSADSSPAPAPAAAPMDSDGDGVFDEVDACRNTPAGATVDSRGCEIDSDRDGVVDSRDDCPDTAMNLAVDNRGCPIIEIVEHRAELLVNFDVDQAVIKPEFRPDITEFADFLKQYPQASSIVIEGHTDSDGAEEYNQDLSERRANAVMENLVEDHDIDDSRLSSVGYGESRPVAPNTTPEGKARNRRIEAAVTVEEETQRPR